METVAQNAATKPLKNPEAKKPEHNIERKRA